MTITNIPPVTLSEDEALRLRLQLSFVEITNGREGLTVAAKYTGVSTETLLRAAAGLTVPRPAARLILLAIGATSPRDRWEAAKSRKDGAQ